LTGEFICEQLDRDDIAIGDIADAAGRSIFGPGYVDVGCVYFGF
jgi:hypothetical protein